MHRWIGTPYRGERRILTVEDPVEYQLDGVNQVQVKAGIGLGFAQVLRSFLRHDPDILMVGQIRDRETAEIAVHAAGRAAARPRDRHRRLLEFVRLLLDRSAGAPAGERPELMVAPRQARRGWPGVSTHPRSRRLASRGMETYNA